MGAHRNDTRRAYRIDRVLCVEVLDDTFTPPADLDPIVMIEEHLAVGRLEPLDAETTRLTGTTSNPMWYAEQLVKIPAPYRITAGQEVRQAARVLGERLVSVVEDQARSG